MERIRLRSKLSTASFSSHYVEKTVNFSDGTAASFQGRNKGGAQQADQLCSLRILQHMYAKGLIVEYALEFKKKLPVRRELGLGLSIGL